MGEIKLYRQIFCFSANGSGTTQVLINANSISASTTSVAGTGSTIIENFLEPTNESLGVYFVNLNPVLYASDMTYELNWFVSYLPDTPEKRLPTRFRISPIVIGQQIEVEILDNNIEIEIG